MLLTFTMTELLNVEVPILYHFIVDIYRLFWPYGIPKRLSVLRCTAWLLTLYNRTLWQLGQTLVLYSVNLIHGLFQLLLLYQHLPEAGNILQCI